MWAQIKWISLHLIKFFCNGWTYQDMTGGQRLKNSLPIDKLNLLKSYLLASLSIDNLTCSNLIYWNFSVMRLQWIIPYLRCFLSVGWFIPFDQQKSFLLKDSTWFQSTLTDQWPFFQLPYTGDRCQIVWQELIH